MALSPIGGYFRKAYQDFSGGLDDYSSPIVVKQNKFTELTNALVNNTGLLEKSKGFTLDGTPFADTSASFIRMLVNYKRGVSVDKLVCAALDAGNTNATYKVDLKETSGDGSYSYVGHTTGTAAFTSANTAVVGTGTAWLSHLKAGDKIKLTAHADSAYTEIETVNSDTSITLVAGGYLGATAVAGPYVARKILNKDYLPTAIVFNNNLVITNGSDTLMTYNNTTLDNVTDADAPKGRFIEAHKSRVFTAGTTGGPSSIYWSAVNNELSWDAAGLEVIFANDNGNICGIKSFADSLIVFKDNGNIYQVIGSFDQDAVGEPDFIRKIDVPSNMGAISGFSAAVREDNKLYFLAETGVYSLDPRMNLEKVSKDIQTSTDNIVLSSGVVANKSFNFDTAAQWATGTADGLRETTGGLIESYYDEQQITGAYQGDNACSVFIDSSNIVHVAYITTDRRYVKYGRYLENKTYTTETVADAQNMTGGSYAWPDTTSTFDAVSIAASASGLVGIAIKRHSTTHAAGIYHFAERVSGTWSNLEVYLVGGPYRPSSTGLSCSYTAGNEPMFAACQGNGVNGEEVSFHSRSAGVWTSNVSIDSFSVINVSLLIGSGTNLHLAATRESTSDIYYYTSTDSGSTWSAGTAISTSSTLSDFGVGGLSLSKDSLGDIILSWTKNLGATDSGKLFKRNITRTTTTTVDSDTTNILKGYCSSNNGDFFYTTKGGYEKFTYDIMHNSGTSAQFVNGSTAVVGVGTNWLTWVAVGDKIRLASDDETKNGTVLTVNSDTSITLAAVYSGGSSTGAYVAKRTQTLTNASSGTLSDSYRQGDRSICANSNTLATAAFGASAEEIRVRRISFKGTWTSAEQTDSTLSSWGTYDVGAETLNGNAITHEIALNSISPATAYSVVTNGSLISSNASLSYSVLRITFISSALAPASLASATMNYVGAGVGSIAPVGIVFDNDYYLSNARSGDSGNTNVLLYDEALAWARIDYPVMFMTRYRGTLYGGASTTGKVYRLLSGYNLNGSAYTLTATSKEDLLGSLELQKEIYKVYVLYKIQPSGTFDFSYRTDNFSTVGGSSWVTTEVDQTVDGIYEIPGISGLLRSVQFKIESDELDTQLGIIGWVVLYGYSNLR